VGEAERAAAGANPEALDVALRRLGVKPLQRIKALNLEWLARYVA
jgi:hypothetical protein